MPSAKSTVHGHVDSFKRLLDTFISELEEMEPTGLPLGPGDTDPECHKVRAVVNNLAEHVLSKGPSMSMIGPYDEIMRDLAKLYKEWNDAPRGSVGAQERRACVNNMRKAKQGMPRRKSWGAPAYPAANAELEFLEQLRRHFRILGEVAGPEVQPRLELVYRRDEKAYIRRELPIKRLENGKCMAFPRTSRQAQG